MPTSLSITYNNSYPVFFTGEAKLSAPSPDHFIAWDYQWLKEDGSYDENPKITTQGPFITLAYHSDWEQPNRGVFTATPKLFNAQQELISTGETLTLIIESDSSGGS